MIYTCSSVGFSKARALAGIAVPPMSSFNPAWKPLPLTVSVCGEFEAVMGLGFNVVIAGSTAGAVTVRVDELLAWPFGLVTCTGRLWALVPALTLTANCVALTEAICD